MGSLHLQASSQRQVLPMGLYHLPCQIISSMQQYFLLGALDPSNSRHQNKTILETKGT